jgi:hypothetical protein
MLIPYGIQTYKRADLPQVVLRNLYAEKAESVPGNLVLLPRPALQPYEMIDTGPIQGLFYQGGALGDSLFTVSNGNLYSGTDLLGSVSTNAIVKMAVADTVLLVATGTALYSTNGTTVAQVAFPDAAGVTSVLYLAGYAIAARANSRRIYFTLDTNTWDALDYVSAQQSTSYIVGMAIVVDQIWLFCQDHTEIFYATGDSDAPFQRVQGRVFDKGAASRDSVVNLDNSVFWVGNDRIVYRGSGVPQRVSDHGIEEMLADADPADLIAWAYPWKGHLFYVLPAIGVAYDAATQQWAAIGSYGRDGWRARLGVRYGNLTIAGDDMSGQLWQLADGVYADDDDPLSREFTVLINENAFIDNLAIDCSVGQQPDPNDAGSTIELRTSRDGGSNWTDWRQASLGRKGASRTYPTWRRLGIVDNGNMVVQIRVTDSVASRISYVRINEPLGGRSR